MWQQPTLTQLQNLLRSDPAIRSVEAYGTGATNELDDWSDLDVAIVVEQPSLSRYFPATDWLQTVGEIYATEQSHDEHTAMTRVVFSDLRRVDLHFVTNDIPMSAPTAPTTEQTSKALDALANSFRFEAILATSKIARNDLLIGAHLVLELERKCLVVVMMQRDLDLGTTQHRKGGHLNEVVRAFKSFPSTASGLLDRIQEATAIFNRLASALDHDFRADWEPIRELVDRARATH